jgi:hydroxypyruvate reductase/glycerate 2-kinase
LFRDSCYNDSESEDSALSVELRRLHARSIVDAAIEAVQPARLVKQALQDPELAAAINQAKRVIVVGGGKAGAGMTEGVESMLADRLDSISGIVNVPDDLWKPTSRIQLRRARPTGINEPTVAAAVGAKEMLALVARATSHDVVLVLLSGGGSALLPAVADGITLGDKIEVTRQLSAAGATIQELNCVRKHLSRIKGGQLVVAASGGGSVWSLIISDVAGNPLDVIASGPTAVDPTTYSDALAIIAKYQLTETLPQTVIDHLADGHSGKFVETPKTLPGNVRNRIIASNIDAVLAAKNQARTLGYEVLNLGADICGDTLEVVQLVASNIPLQPVSPPMCIVLGGETTVHLGPNPGLGGRNQEFVLALADELARREMNQNGMSLVSVGTDGEDGPTDAAGAIWDETVANRANEWTTDRKRYLEQHNTYRFFERAGGLIKTGLTGTNVMDVRIILVGDV